MAINKDILKRYPDEERPHSQCYDCGLSYEDFICDMLIQPHVWELINPTFHRGCGLLCPNCICRRLVRGLGLTCVNCMVDLVDLTPDEAKALIPESIYADPDAHKE